MKKTNRLRKRKFKVVERDISPVDIAYRTYSSLMSRLLGKDASRMDLETFIADADMRGTDITNKEALLRAARQRAASAAHQLTTEQAKNLKRALLDLSDADLAAGGFSRRDIKQMKIEAYKSMPASEFGKGMISQFYEILKEQGLTVQEAGKWISAEIYGS